MWKSVHIRNDSEIICTHCKLPKKTITKLRSAPCSFHSQQTQLFAAFQTSNLPINSLTPRGLLSFWNHNTFQQFRITLHTKLSQQFYIWTFFLQLCYMHKSVPICCTVLFISWSVHVSAWPNRPSSQHSVWSIPPRSLPTHSIFMQQIQYSPNIWYVLWSTQKFLFIFCFTLKF